MARRKSTGKRLRFEIFKRDQFTCQYCGKQPPEVVLVIDHITPVADGGLTTIENLITSCEPCNQGKGARSLTARAVRPDADLLYLETQQEIAELRRFQESQRQLAEERDRVVELLQDVWVERSGLTWAPGKSIIVELLSLHDPALAMEAIEDVAYKVGGGYVSTEGRKWVGYLFAVARTMARERQEVDESTRPEQLDEPNRAVVTEAAVETRPAPGEPPKERIEAAAVCTYCGRPYLTWLGHKRRCEQYKASLVAAQTDLEGG